MRPEFNMTITVRPYRTSQSRRFHLAPCADRPARTQYREPIRIERPINAGKSPRHSHQLVRVITSGVPKGVCPGAMPAIRLGGKSGMNAKSEKGLYFCAAWRTVSIIAGSIWLFTSAEFMDVRTGLIKGRSDRRGPNHKKASISTGTIMIPGWPLTNSIPLQSEERNPMGGLGPSIAILFMKKLYQIRRRFSDNYFSVETGSCRFKPMRIQSFYGRRSTGRVYNGFRVEGFLRRRLARRLERRASARINRRYHSRDPAGRHSPGGTRAVGSPAVLSAWHNLPGRGGPGSGRRPARRSFPVSRLRSGVPG